MSTRSLPASDGARLLIVDDNTAIHDDFRKVLKVGSPEQAENAEKLAGFRAAFLSKAPEVQAPKQALELLFASQGLEALSIVQRELEAGRPISLAFLDVRMPPGIDGIETARRLWEIDPHLQIVICSAYSDHSWEDMVKRLGASDRWVIMRKPFDAIAARQLVTAMVCKWRSSRLERERAGELERLVEERTQALCTANAKLRDEMASLERAQARIDYMAHHDPLTELPNRRFVERHLERRLREARASGERLAVLSVDIDHFKRINDSLGHTAGDEVLRQVSERLKAGVRSSDVIGCYSNGDLSSTVARSGGDEFVIIFAGVRSEEHVVAAARRLERLISEPMQVNKHEIRVTSSIGVSLFPDHGQSSADLIGTADCAMHNIKRHGRGNVQLYSVAIARTSPSELVVETGLIRALAASELVLHYQPIVDPLDGRLHGLESLVRWQHPTRGLLPPGEFLPLAEEVGLMGLLGEWITNEACQQARRWLDAGVDFGTLSINVSATQLEQAGGSSLVQMIQDALSSANLPPERVVIELTETALLKRGFEALRALAESGVRIALDDFGTGYSSLKHLVQLPIYALKIDSSFVRNAHQRPQPAAVVKAIIGMAHSLKLQVVAEGVETWEELAFLERFGCRAIQGYFYSRPVPAAEVPEIIQHVARHNAARLAG